MSEKQIEKQILDLIINNQKYELIAERKNPNIDILWLSVKAQNEAPTQKKWFRSLEEALKYLTKLGASREQLMQTSKYTSKYFRDIKTGQPQTF